MDFTDIILSKGSQTLCTEYVLYISIYIKFKNRQNKPMVLTSGWPLIFGGERAEGGTRSDSGRWLYSVLSEKRTELYAFDRYSFFYICLHGSHIGRN